MELVCPSPAVYEHTLEILNGADDNTKIKNQIMGTKSFNKPLITDSENNYQNNEADKTIYNKNCVCVCGERDREGSAGESQARGVIV